MQQPCSLSKTNKTLTVGLLLPAKKRPWPAIAFVPLGPRASISMLCQHEDVPAKALMPGLQEPRFRNSRKLGSENGFFRPDLTFYFPIGFGVEKQASHRLDEKKSLGRRQGDCGLRGLPTTPNCGSSSTKILSTREFCWGGTSRMNINTPT